MHKAELLWLWYDYQTETFDQQLSNVPSPTDDGSVIVTGRHRSLSDKHAYSLYQQIYFIADYYNIPRELMNDEKRYRLRETTRRRMEKYKWLLDNKPHEFKFIDDYHEMMDRKQTVNPFQSGLYDVL